MKKPIIGVVPTLTYKKGPSIFDDQFKFVNSYTKKLQESGATPIGLLMPDGNLDPEILDMCDGFLIPGGNQVRLYIYQILYYSIKNDVPILGICLGAQAMSIFSALLDKLSKEEILTHEIIKEHYDELKKQNEGTVLRKLPSGHMHYTKNITRDNIDDSRHDIRIHKGTLLYDIIGKGNMSVASFHGFDFKFLHSGFIASADASDGVKEAIEFNDPSKFILGVHFHAELEKDNKLFDRLIYESKKRKR